VKFWRSKAKAEVDFILDQEGLIAIESKSGGKSETRSLKSFKEKYKPNKTVILCREKLLDDEGTLIMPFIFASTLIASNI
jgi:predicted AAA+ superfamily ATPase